MKIILHRLSKRASKLLPSRALAFFPLIIKKFCIPFHLFFLVHPRNNVKNVINPGFEGGPQTKSCFALKAEAVQTSNSKCITYVSSFILISSNLLKAETMPISSIYMLILRSLDPDFAEISPHTLQ